MLLASCILFIKCTSEPIAGADGLAGADGINGSDGTNGVDGTASCIACHNNTKNELTESSYMLSIHAKETLHESSGAMITTSTYTNRTGCVECHTSQGYIDLMNGATLATGTGYPSGLAYSGNQAITCTTCHSTHSTFDFVNDGQDFALRQGTAPISLASDNTYLMDMGTSNTCVNCHQPRSLPPSVAPVSINNRFGPHHGPQSTILEGIQGAMYAGSVAYPAPKSAVHRKGASCTSCHMGESDTDSHNGLHSWHPSEKACLSCHTSGAPTEVAGFATDLATLKGLLETKGFLDPTTGSLNTKTGLTLKEGQAAWNYVLLVEDRSNGIHNPAYAKALLKNSIEALK